MSKKSKKSLLNKTEYLDSYIRVSTTQQKKDGNSLEVQEKMGKEVSKKLGLTFRPHMEGSRSSTIHYREVLEELKYKITRGEVKNIWIQDKSRLFRDMTDGMIFRRDYLEKYRITLYEGLLPTKLDLDSPEEKLFYSQMMSFSQYENENRSRKSQYGKIHKLKTLSPTKPIFLGGTNTYGYININKEWVVESTESKWVKFIFTSYEKGKTIKEIKTLLDREGVPPRRTGNGLWNTGTLHKMLMNKTYTGIHSINQYVKSNEEEYKKDNENKYVITIDKDRERIYKRVIDTFNYKVPKIINVGQFNRVNKLLQKNFKNHNNNKKHFSLLEDFLVCECGTNMGSRHLKTTSSLGYKVDTRTYYCLSKLKDWKSGNEPVCVNKKSLQMDSLNEYVLGFVKEKVSKSNILKEKFKLEVLEKKFQRMKDIEGTEKTLELKLQTIQQQIDETENNIVEMYVKKSSGDLDENIVSKIIKRYGDELESKKVRYEEIEKEIDDLGQDKKWLNWIEKYGETLELQTSNEEKQKDFLKGVLKNITIKSEYQKNRDGKEVQQGHSVDFRFKLKIVDDDYQVISKETKPRTYRVVEGKDKQGSDGVIKFVSQRNRTKKKKIKNDSDKGFKLFHQLDTLHNCRVEPTDEITSSKYSHYLCFSVKVRTNKFVYFQTEKYTSQQEKIYQLIKSLHDGGLGYRKISYYLNDKGILTNRGKKWGSNNVYSVLKRYKQREERLEYINREYEPVWGKMEVVWKKN